MLAVLGRQLRAALEDVGRDQAGRVTVAYEPVWAIGTGRTATPEIAQEVHAHVRTALSELFGDELAGACRILYGGSVKPENFGALIAQEDIDGGLVGGASLRPESLVALVETASRLRPRPV